MLAYRWEAGEHLKRKLEAAGMRTEGAPAGWAEVYRVFKECKVWMTANPDSFIN